MMDTQNPRPNPYVGPRAFETGEQLYGRERDVTNLYYLFLSERIVLLFSPSGAGKSSLIKAGLLPRLTPKFNILPVIRVNLEPPPQMARKDGLNRYVFSALLSMEQNRPENEQIKQSELASMTLIQYLDRRRAEMPPPPPPADDFEDAPTGLYDALIFDQFEEILTIAPNDYDGKRVFFEQLGEALRDTRRWALFAAREDHTAAFEPYLRNLPGRLLVRHRLDLLEASTARQAIQAPAEAAGVNFTDEAADRLIEDLRRVKVQRPDGTTDTEPGRFVEPVQLQVVCYRLWKNLAVGATEIGLEQVIALGDVDNALAAYYSEQVSLASQLLNTPEREIREWFNTRLITESGIRSQVIRGKTSSGGLDNNVIRQFENAHILRTEKRAGATWYELAHDRMIEPVRKSNEAWFQSNLSLLQRQTLLWLQRDRSPGLLLNGKELLAAEQESHDRTLTGEEEEFLITSQKARDEISVREKRRLRILQGLVVGIAIALVIAIGLGFTAFIQAGNASTNAATAQAASTLAVEQANAANAASTDSVMQARSAQTAEALARQNANSARARELAAISTSNLNNRLNTVSLLLAVEAVRLDGRVSSSLLAALSEAPALRRFLSGHEKAVNSLAYSPDGAHLASGGGDARLMYWDSSSGQLLYINSDHTAAITAVQFSPDGKVLASGDEKNWIIFSDAASGATIQKNQVGDAAGIRALAYSPNGKILAIAAGQTNSQEGKPRIDSVIYLWDTESGQLITTLNADPNQPWRHTSTITSLAFSPNGERMVSGSADSSILLWDMTNPAQAFPLMPLQSHSGGVASVAFNPDGLTLASASTDKTIMIWDATLPNMAAARPLLLQTLSAHTAAVYSLAYSPDGKRLVSGGADKQVIVWDLARGRPLGEPFTQHTADVTTVGFAPDGTTVASGGLDTKIILWDANQTSRLAREIVLNQPAFTSLAYAASHKALLAGTQDGTILAINLSGETPQVVQLKEYTDTVNAISVAPEGSVFASAGLDGRILFWDTASNKTIGAPIVADGVVNVLAFDHSGDFLASGGANGDLVIWDAQSRQRLAQLPNQNNSAVKSLVFSPDGSFLVAGYADQTFSIWDTDSYTLLSGPLNLFTSVNAMAITSDGKSMAFSGPQNTVALWGLADPANPIDRGARKELSSSVNSLAFSPSNDFLVAGDSSGNVILWNGSEVSGQALTGHADQVRAVAFGSDANSLFSAGADGKILAWDLNLEHWKDLACDIAGRNLTIGEWEQYFPNQAYQNTCELWALSERVPTPTPLVSSSTTVPTPVVTKGVDPAQPTQTSTPQPTQAPVSSIQGGADKMIFLRENEIWQMDMNGGALQQLTFDKKPKHSLQWLPDIKSLMYIADQAVLMVDLDTGDTTSLFAPNFNAAENLNDLRISPDGERLAVSVGGTPYILDFDLEALQKIQNEGSLTAESTCLPAKRTSGVQHFVWGDSSTSLAWVSELADDLLSFRARQEIQVFDLNCETDQLEKLASFPQLLFWTESGAFKNAAIPSFDWDGEDQIIFNTSLDESGWGQLFLYNLNQESGRRRLDPLGFPCCYRDARWSPDGSYLFFAFRNSANNPYALTEFYYVPFADIGTKNSFAPIQLTDGFFKTPGEAPDPALHPIP